MNDPEAENFEAVDRLVRAHLDREQAQTDATQLHSRILQALADPLASDLTCSTSALAPGRNLERSTRLLRWSLAAAAAAVLLVGGIVGGLSFHPASAKAATLLRHTRAVHSHEIDRCYRVHFAPDPRYWNKKNMLEGPSESVLWTRGDRFWSDCTIGTLRLAIGREPDGTLWISPSRKKGIQFSGGDARIPSEVAVLCDINSMTVPALLDEVLADFSLRSEGPNFASVEPTTVVWATRKPGRTHPLIATALLEIDARSDVLVRLVIWTLRDSRPNGTVTYTLLDSARQNDNQYRLEAHLDPDAEVEHHRFGIGRVDDWESGR